MLEILAAMTVLATPNPGEPASPPLDAARVELCYAHAVRDIRNIAVATGGNVAGPAFFVRDWWGERLREDWVFRSEEPMIEAIDTRAGTDPDGVEAESLACSQQAQDGGAWPPS